MGGLSPELEGKVYPKGREALDPGEDPEGFILTEEERATFYREQGRQEALQAAQDTARAEARSAAKQGLTEVLEGRKSQINAFKSFLGSLEDLVQGSDTGTAPEGRTEVVLKLHRVMDNGGPRPVMAFQKQWIFDAPEALTLGDPDFEGRTMAWAKETGRFGKFQWRIMGWAAGENTLDTTYAVTVEEPEGYKPPAVPRLPEPDPTPMLPADPLEGLRNGLGIVAEVQKVLGMGGSKGNGDAEKVARMTGELEGRRAAEEEHRRRVQELEDRHRKALAEVEAAAYKRGQEEGDRKARWELEDQLRDLRWKMRQEDGPDMLDKIVSFAGGPEGVSSLLSAVVGAMNRGNAAKAAPGKPAPRPALQTAPNAAPNPTPRPAPRPVTAQAPPAAPAEGAEPSRAEHLQAMADLGEALAVLEAFEEQQPGQDPKIPEAINLLNQVEEAGRMEGSLSAWWKAYRERFAPMVAHILSSQEEPGPQAPEEEGTMDMNGLKALLIRRLDEGAETDAIIAEARAVLTPEQQAEWLPMLKAMPRIFLGRLLGVPHHQARLAALVEALPD